MSSKRKAPSTTSTHASTSTPKPARASKLAKEHNITAAQESEIRESFSLFAVPAKGSKEGVIPVPDVRRALVALNLAPSKSELAEFLEILDPDESGVAEYGSFVAIAALKMHQKGEGGERQREEMEEAWGLFVASGMGGGGGEEKITLATLKRVARALKEDVDEALLRDMILEANGGGGVGKGVDRGEFEGVMRRAGVWR